ncbi:MAG: TolC family protein [Polyangiaceae bacterium]
MKVRASILALLALGTTSSVAFAADPPKVEAKVETKVDDPMLTPVAPAQKNVTSWEDARNHVKARSTDLRIALADVQRAEAAWRLALASALPSLGLAGVASKDLVPSTQAYIDQTNPAAPKVVEVPRQSLAARASFDMPLVDVRTWYNVGTADRTIDATRLSLEDAKRVLLTGVVTALVAVYTSERVAEIGRIGLRNALERLELTKQRVTLGAGNKLDVLRVETDVANARATLVGNNETLRQAREALGLALGYGNAVGVTPELRLDGIEGDALKTCKTLGKVEERPDVLGLGKRIEAADRGRTSAKLAFLPILSGSSSAGRSTIQGDVFVWNIQATLTFTLWDGGARYANMRDAAAQTEAATQRREALIRQASIDVARAKRSVTVAEDSRTVAQQARDAAFETDRLTRTSYTEGRGTSLELVTAATALRQADVNLALREFELVRARLLAALTLSRCDL